MTRFKRGQDINQGLLLPPSLLDWLPEDHLAWFIRDVVESLDVDALLDSYRVSGKGELPYDPRLMLRVLIYAYSTGTFSSRKIATQLQESVAYRVLAGNQMPGHRTICRFRQHHIAQFSELFVQVVRLARESGLTSLGTLAIDGSKVKANASKHKAMSFERMNKEEKRLEREIEAITKMADDTDEAEDVEFGPDFRGDELPQELARRETRLKKIQEAKERLECRKAEEARQADVKREQKAKAEGREPPKERPNARKYPKGQPKPKDQENFTDPESRIMKTSKGYEQSFNAQIAVDGESRLIVATKVTNCAADVEELIPMVERAEANTGENVGEVLADAGYQSEENFTALESANIDGYVPTRRKRKSASEAKDDSVPTEQNATASTMDDDVAVATKNNAAPTVDDDTATKRMQRKLRTKNGRERYRRRKHVAESPFGWVKNVLGFRSFSLRGSTKVQGEWDLLCLALNLRRMQGMGT
jgi:transposase